MRWGVSIKPKPKYVQETKETRAEIVDRFVTEIDPAMMLVITLAAGAGLMGQAGPLTRILSTLPGGNSPTGANRTDGLSHIPLTGEQAHHIDFGPFGLGLSGPVGQFVYHSILGNPTEVTGTDKQDYYERVGMAMSNAVEAAIMYKMAASPEIMSTVLKMPAEVLKGLGEVVPG